MEDRENITEVLPGGESQDTLPQPKPGDVSTFTPFQKALLIILVIVIVIIIVLPNYLLVNQRKMESARNTLRSLGQAELAYQKRNNLKDFATYDRLMIEGYMPTRSNPSDLIPDYYLTLSVYNPVYTPGMDSWGGNLFTIIAFPDNPQRLDTFCITEDQRLRVYNPDHGNKYDAIYHWDQVL